MAVALVFRARPVRALQPVRDIAAMTTLLFIPQRLFATDGCISARCCFMTGDRS